MQWKVFDRYVKLEIYWFLVLKVFYYNYLYKTQKILFH